MIYFMISVIIGLISLQYYGLNYQIQGLNRAIISTPIELMYKSVIYGDPPLFEKEDFEDIVISYYDTILPRYSNNYHVGFYYYNSSDDSMCLTNGCDGVEITIDCKLNISYQYHRVMFYEMSEGIH